MADLIAHYESTIRMGVFAGVLLLMAILEWAIPRKKRTLPRGKRWLTNAAIIVIDTIALRLTMPIVAVGTAIWASANGWGALNHLSAPLWLEALIAILLLDMAVYGQHVATHKIPFLWALHQVHHADRDIDVTTGVRFHPIEIIFSMVYKLGIVLLLGPAAFAVVIFEVLLNASAMFNHANVKIPLGIDNIARRLVVTPDMHRVHHSVHREEHDNNYGFFLSVWDRIFGTYTPQPRDGHEDMTIGLAHYQSEKPASLIWSMTLPFHGLLSRK